MGGKSSKKSVPQPTVHNGLNRQSNLFNTPLPTYSTSSAFRSGTKPPPSKPSTSSWEDLLSDQLLNDFNNLIQPAPTWRTTPQPTYASRSSSVYSRPEYPLYRSQIQQRIVRKPISTAEKSVYIPIIEKRDTVVSYSALDPFDWEFQKISKLVTNRRNFKIDLIERIENPFLEAAYELKIIQKKMRDEDSEERYLFHGTKEAIVDTICENNFDWRKCQQHKFGKGVSFSPNSTYASNYSDRNVYSKVMLVAKVLIGNICTGNEFMELPDPGCDTSQKPGGVVIVKFDDHEFYPAYKITYHLLDETQGRVVGSRRHRRR